MVYTTEFKYISKQIYLYNHTLASCVGLYLLGRLINYVDIKI